MAAEQTDPMPTLPPEPRTLQLTPGGKSETPRPVTQQKGPQLSAEVLALKQALERVRASLLGNSTVAPIEASDPTRGTHSDSTRPQVIGEIRQGSTFKEQLHVRLTASGGALVTADIGPETAEKILKELVGLIGISLDEVAPVALKHQIHLRVSQVPYVDTLDRLLGQLGLRWTEEVRGKARILIVENALATKDDLDRRARRALARVAATVHGPAAAEAMYLIASQDAQARRHAAALKEYSELVDAYGATGDPAIVRWVQMATRGSGESMLALGAFADARVAFRAWLARVDPSDPDGARILLLSAETARRLGDNRADAGAYDEAVDDLHRLLETYSRDQRAATEVAAARLAIGEMLFKAGKQALSLPGGEVNEVPPEAQGRFREAEIQIKSWLKSTGRGVENAPDQANFWLAECAFNLGRGDEARPKYERLYHRWKTGDMDSQADPTIYATAAFRAGECWLRRTPPDHVRALFAFLRARQDFPKSEIESYLLLRIAQCYAELEVEDQAVNSLYDLLRNDQVNDSRPGRQQLDQLLGELIRKLGTYPGPVRARVLFYIARAQWLHARRDRTDQAASAKQAAATYRRVLDEKPLPELRHAAGLGLSRSLLLAGEDVRGEEELRRFLRDPTISPRDREYAAQILGEHLRAKGRLREAIQAFRGEVPE